MSDRVSVEVSECRLYEAMGEAEQVLKAIEEDREDGEDDGAP